MSKGPSIQGSKRSLSPESRFLQKKVQNSCKEYGNEIYLAARNKCRTPIERIVKEVTSGKVKIEENKGDLAEKTSKLKESLRNFEVKRTVKLMNDSLTGIFRKDQSNESYLSNESIGYQAKALSIVESYVDERMEGQMAPPPVSHRARDFRGKLEGQKEAGRIKGYKRRMKGRNGGKGSLGGKQVGKTQEYQIITMTPADTVTDPNILHRNLKIKGRFSKETESKNDVKKETLENNWSNLKLKRVQAKEERKKRALEFKNRMSEVLGKEYLYKKIQRQFEDSQQQQKKVEQEIIDQKRRVYNPKRGKNGELHSPYRNLEMKKFAKKYEQELQKLEAKKKDQREEWYKNLGNGLPYKSKLPYNKKLMEILEKEKLAKLEQDYKKQALKEKTKKAQAYAKMVKDIHWPAISPEKNLEVIERKKELSRKKGKPNNRSISPIFHSSHKSLKKGMPMIKETSIQPKTRNKRTLLTKIKWGKSMYTKEQEKIQKEAKKEYKNYLLEFQPKKKGTKQGHDDIDENEAFTPYWDWKSINNDTSIDDAAKVELLKEKANMLQERSELNEKLLDTGTVEPEKSSITNNFLIASIEAKLAILQQMNS
ncbi:unnamed protein product [Moneuplotes crassus]|uniref:Uncharacterized protein n=2 Tax=Euplotes crassus TaxID=5936 RepID=A0AAD2DAF7_EUPCR|nr:unnamed protein product [Moneuplotes crassus]